MKELFQKLLMWLSGLKPAPTKNKPVLDIPAKPLPDAPINRARAIIMFSNEEGRKNRPYDDSEGYLTIGVGHLMDPRKGGSLPEWAQFELDSAGFLSELSIDRLLEDDMLIAMGHIEKLLPWALKLDPVRYGVLLDMCFQMGIGNAQKGTGLLGFKNTLAMIQRGDYAAASEGMKHSKWYRQTPNRANRRRAEMLTGKFHDYA